MAVSTIPGDAVHSTPELRSSEERLDEFVYAVSHDLHAPVRQVRALIELLRRDPSASAKMLDMMEGSLRRADHMFEGLLELSRIGRVPHILAKHPASTLLTTLRSELDVPDSVTLVLPAETPSVNDDRGRLRQAVAELIANSIAHGSPGGDAIAVTVVAEHDPERGHVIVSVSDDGIGMSARVLSSSRRLFFTDRPRDTGHLGVGLALVQRIVDAYEGSFTLESTPDVGTTALVYWPDSGT